MLENNILQKLAEEPGTPERMAITEADETAVTAVTNISSLVVLE